MADKERRSPLLLVAGDGLLLLCALWGLTACFLSLYGNPDAPWREVGGLDRCAAGAEQLLLWAAAAALLALAAWSLPRFRDAAAGGLTALWALAALLCGPDLIRGAGIAVRDISILFSKRVYWGREFLYDPGLTTTEEAQAVWLFLMLVIPALALLLGWSVVRARRWWLVVLFTLPPLLPGLLADLYPDWPAFLALCACWCVMILTSLCKWAAPSGRGKLTLVVFPCVAAVLALITLAFPREGYTRPSWALKAQEDLMNLTSHMSGFFSRWDGPFHSTVAYVGAAEEADLSRAGPLDYFGRTVLRVNSDYDGRLYLRGSSLAVYEDGVWKALPEETYQEYLASLGNLENPLSPLVFPAALNGRTATSTVTVENIGAVGACVYAPYFPTDQDWNALGMLPVEDAYFARKQGQWTHTVEFCPPEVVPIYGGGSAESAAYQDYVYDHYLDVPDDLRDTLDQYVHMWFFAQSTFSYYSAPGTIPSVPLAQELGAFLSTFCEYDIETPPAPEGTDPVLYFLTESRRGYCMHYASAVTLMLRTQGIPARYVSGFTTVSVPGKRVDVPDRAAHAWVEVWEDGFGWYPVEVTPAAAFTWYDQGTAPGESPTVPPTEAYTPEPTPTPSQSPSAQPSQQPSAGPQGGGDDPQGGGGGLSIPPWLIKALAIPAGIFALLWLVQFALKRFRAKRMAGPDANQSALACYGYLRRLERWGGRMDPRAVELAQKARFSQHTLTEEELALLRRLVDRERTRLCVVCALPKRLVIRFLWGMPSPPVSLKEDE